MYAIEMQNIKPKIAKPNISLVFLTIAEISIKTYPINPIKGVGIPYVFETAPLIIASQLTVLFKLHG
jgi:hypothetical protein